MGLVETLSLCCWNSQGFPESHKWQHLPCRQNLCLGLPPIPITVCLGVNPASWPCLWFWIVLGLGMDSLSWSLSQTMFFFLFDYNIYLSKNLCPSLPYLPYKRALIQTIPTGRTPDDILKDTTEMELGWNIGGSGQKWGWVEQRKYFTVSKGISTWMAVSSFYCRNESFCHKYYTLQMYH